MNILVIGNGFDLAHVLPTKYTNFLNFCKKIEGIYTYANNKNYKSYVRENLNGWMINNEIKQALEEAYKSRKINYHEKGLDGLKVHTNFKYLDELYACIKENIWIEYFMKCNMIGKENWIDFESEISEVVQSLGEDMNIVGGNIRIENNIQKISNFLLNAKYYGLPKTYKDVRDDLLNNLNKLIRAFEIYLTEYIEKIEIQKKSPNIDALEIDHILSFNYTNTYEKVYNNFKDVEYDYIHGKADIGNTIDTDNIVLGIDEYLPEKRRNKDIDFIAFKKYYQRILKQTGCKYKEWVDEIRNNQHASYNEYNLYIFGHSLDVTDKDILRDVILNDNVYTTIFYHNKDVMGQQIANLVKAIGQDELIRRTGGSTKTINFELQKDMEPIEK